MRTSLRSLIPFVVALVIFSSGCTEESEPAPMDVSDVVDVAAEVEELCGVHVVLDPRTCTGCFDNASVIVDGEEIGTVTVAEEFFSTEMWTCDTMLDIEVRTLGITTGVRNLAVSLEPDIPLTCELLCP